MKHACLVLGVAAVVVGYAVNPTQGLGAIPAHWLTVDFLGNGKLIHIEVEAFNFRIAGASSAVAVTGIVLAFLMYSPRRMISPERVGAWFKPVYILLYRKYFFDELYEGLLIRRVFYGGLCRVTDWADKFIVDRIVNLLGWLGANIGGALRQFQTGQAQSYGLGILVGILMIVGIYMVFL